MRVMKEDIINANVGGYQALLVMLKTLVTLFKHIDTSSSPTNIEATQFIDAVQERNMVEDLLKSILILYHNLTISTHNKPVTAAQEIQEYSSSLITCLSASISTFPLLLSLVQAALEETLAPDLLDSWIRRAAKTPRAAICLMEFTSSNDQHFMTVWDYVMEPARWLQPNYIPNLHQTLCADLCQSYFSGYLDASPRSAPIAQAIIGSTKLLALFRDGPLWRVMAEEPSLADTIMCICTKALNDDVPTSRNVDRSFLSYITGALLEGGFEAIVQIAGQGITEAANMELMQTGMITYTDVKCVISSLSSVLEHNAERIARMPPADKQMVMERCRLARQVQMELGIPPVRIGAEGPGHLSSPDELVMTPTTVANVQQNALDGDTLTLPAYAQAGTGPTTATPVSSGGTPRKLRRHPGFRLFATQNPGTGAFRGMRLPLSRAFLDRFHRLEFLPLGPDEWSQIVRRRLGKADLVQGCSAVTTGSNHPAFSAASQQKPGECDTGRLQWIADRMVSFHQALQAALQPPTASGSVATFPERGAHATITIRELLRWSQRMKSTLMRSAAVTTAAGPSSAPRSAAETEDWLASEAWSIYGARFGSAGANVVRRLIATELLREADIDAKRDASSAAATARLDMLTDVTSWSLDGHGSGLCRGPVVCIGGAIAEGAPEIDVTLLWRKEVEDRTCQNSPLLRRMDEVHQAVRRVVLSRGFVEAHGLYPVYGRAWLWDWVRAVHSMKTDAFCTPQGRGSMVISHEAGLLGAVLYASRVRGSLARDCILACFQKECEVVVQEAEKRLTAVQRGCPVPGAPFVVTERVLQLWRAMCASLAASSRGDGSEGRGVPEALLVVGRSGCGKSLAARVLGELLGWRVSTACMTSETTSATLVGQLQPCCATTEGINGPAGGIKWHDGVVSAAYKAGSWLILDNLDQAEPAVVERLNPVLETPPVWNLGEKCQLPASRTAAQCDAAKEECMLPKRLVRGHGFLAIGTMSTSAGSTHGSGGGLSPALANRFTQIYMADMAAGGVTRDAAGEQSKLCQCEASKLVGALLGAALHDDTQRRFASSFVQAVWGLREQTMPGITFRTVIRLLDAAYRTCCCPSATDAGALRHMTTSQILWGAFQTTVLQQAQPVARNAAEIHVLESLRREGLWDERAPPEIPRRQLHLQCSSTSQILTPSRCVLAEAVLAAVATGCPVLLEGPAAVGKTSLLGALAESHAVPLLRVNNTDTTSLVDYFGSWLPCSGGAFKFCRGQLLAAVEDGQWFLADELNLAPGGVLSALMPLLEGQSRFLVPGKEVEAQVHPSFRFFATQNPSKYAGRQPLPIAVRARFLELQMAKVYHGLRANGHRCTMRELVKWVRRAHLLQEAEGGGKINAERWVAAGLSLFLSERVPSPSLNVQHGTAVDTVATPTQSLQQPVGVDDSLQEVRNIVADTFEVQLPDPANSVNVVQLPNNRVSFQDGSMKVIVEGGRLERCPLLFEPGETGALPASLPEAFRRALVQMAFAVAAREPVLLLGPTSFKTKLVETWAMVFQPEHRANSPLSAEEELFRVHLTTDTEAPELIGHIQPASVLSLLQSLPELVLQLHARCLSVLPTCGGDMTVEGANKGMSHPLRTSEGLTRLRYLLNNMSNRIAPQLELLITQFVSTVQAAQIAHTRQAEEASLKVDESKDGVHKPTIWPPVAASGQQSLAAASSLIIAARSDISHDAGDDTLASEHNAESEAWRASSVLLAGSPLLTGWTGEEVHTPLGHVKRSSPDVVVSAAEDDVSSISSIGSWFSDDINWNYDTDRVNMRPNDDDADATSIARDNDHEQQQQQQSCPTAGAADYGASEICCNIKREVVSSESGSQPSNAIYLQITDCDDSVELRDAAGPEGQCAGGKDSAMQARHEGLECITDDGLSDFSSSRDDASDYCSQHVQYDVEANYCIRHDPTKLHVSMSSELTLKLDELLSTLEAVQQVQALGADSAVLQTCAKITKMVNIFTSTNLAGEVGPWYGTAFIFRDGPVTTAARLSRPILLEDVDQPSQAVAERLNSLLETEPTFSVAEDLSLEVDNGRKNVELLPGFHIFATASVDCHSSRPSSASTLCCSLSPAMRSRFTTIVVPEYSPFEVESILMQQIAACVPDSEQDLSRHKHLCSVMMQLWTLLARESAGVDNRPACLLPLLRWVDFLTTGDTALGGGGECDSPDYQERLAAGARFCMLDHLRLPEQEQLAEEWWRAAGLGEIPSWVRAVFQEPLATVLGKGKLFELLRHGRGEAGGQAWRVRLRYCGVEAPLQHEETHVAETVSMESLDTRWDALVPTTTLIMNVARIFAALTLRAPLLLEGPPGVGKTEVVRGIARLLGNRCERLSLSGSTTVEELFGCFVPRLDGGRRIFGWQDGVLSRLLKGSGAGPENSSGGGGWAVGGEASSCWVLLDELNLASPDVLECIAPLFARDRRPFVIPGSGEVVRDHDIRWFATINPASTGGGRRQLPRAIQSTMVMVHLGEYSEGEILQIARHMFRDLLARGHLRDEHVHSILAVHNGLRRAIDDGEVSMHGGLVNLRDIRKLCAVLETCLQDLHVHFELYLQSESGKGPPPGTRLIVYALRRFIDLVYGSRFEDQADIATLSTLLDKTLPMQGGAFVRDLCGQMAVEKMPGLLRIGPVYLETGDHYQEDREASQEDEVELQVRMPTFVDNDQGRDLGYGKLVHNPATVKHLELMAAACRGRFGVLLEGPTCSGKTSLVKELARLAQRKLLIVPCNQELEASHLIGQLMQVSTTADLLANPEEAYTKWVKPAMNIVLGDVIPWLMQDDQRHTQLTPQQLLQQLAKAVSTVSVVSSSNLDVQDASSNSSPADVIQCAASVCKLLNNIQRQLANAMGEAEFGLPQVGTIISRYNWLRVIN
eukprot:gene1994-2679_t